MICTACFNEFSMINRKVSGCYGKVSGYCGISGKGENH